jgi:pimeloyl-ACP methyl ester carboxylesterase
MKSVITYTGGADENPVRLQARPIGGFEANSDKPLIIWAHGWGRGPGDFIPFAKALNSLADHYVLTLPGFGDTNVPPGDWGSPEYARFIAGFIAGEIDPNRNIIWIGHSFGAKLGLYLAGTPEFNIDFVGLILLACPGLPHQKPWSERIFVTTKIYTFKVLKTLFPFMKDRLINYFGSRDYRAAGPMRTILTRVVGENVTHLLSKITTPVHLIYGEKDSATPPAIGHAMVRQLSNSKITILKRQDHISLITDGRQVCLSTIKKDLLKWS